MVALRTWITAALMVLAGCLRAGEVVVAVPLSTQPYFIPIEGSGLAFDVIKAAFGARGVSVRPLFVSSRQIDTLPGRDSNADCVPMISADSDQHGWSAAKDILVLHDFAITRPGIVLNSIDDLAGKRILAFRGAMTTLGGAFLAVAKDNPEYREINNHRAQLRLLLHGRVDVIIADRLLAAWYLDYLRGEGETDTAVIFHDLFEPAARRFVCRDSGVTDQFDAGLEQIIDNGTLESILARYGSDTATLFSRLD